MIPGQSKYLFCAVKELEILFFFLDWQFLDQTILKALINLIVILGFFFVVVVLSSLLIY